MCGIVGFITNETDLGSVERAEYFKMALLLDTIRGKDSTGFFATPHDWTTKTWPNNQPFAEYYKAVEPGHEFVTRPEFHRYFNGEHRGAHEHRFMVGHNRAATVGGVSIKTAHPFREGPITLVHNGTLESTLALKKSRYELSAYNDSHTICHNLAIESAEEVISKLDGAFALVWHDMRDDSLNIVRNSKRPFHMAMAKDHGTIFFASEGEMIKYIAKRKKINLGSVASLKPGWLLKFQGENVMKPFYKKVEFYKKVYSAGNNWNKNHTKTVSNNTTTKTTSENKVNPDPKVRWGGRKREVPERHQINLLELDLLPEVYQNFIPGKMERVNWGDNLDMTNITGYLEGTVGSEPGHMCILYGVDRQRWVQCSNRTWTVCPIAVRYTESGDPIVIAQLISTISVQGEIKYTSHYYSITPKKHPKNQDWIKKMYPNKVEDTVLAELPEPHPTVLDCGCTEDGELCDDHKLVEGPEGSDISVRQFNKMVSHGCCLCSDPIPIFDAGKITWLNNGRDPMCVACSEAEFSDNTPPWLH